MTQFNQEETVTYGNKENGYVKCDTFDQFEEFLQHGMWEDEKDFQKETGFGFEALKGEWFIVVHSRIYLESDY